MTYNLETMQRLHKNGTNVTKLIKQGSIDWHLVLNDELTIDGKLDLLSFGPFAQGTDFAEVLRDFIPMHKASEALQAYEKAGVNVATKLMNSFKYDQGKKVWQEIFERASDQSLKLRLLESKSFAEASLEEGGFAKVIKSISSGSRVKALKAYKAAGVDIELKLLELISDRPEGYAAGEPGWRYILKNTAAEDEILELLELPEFSRDINLDQVTALLPHHLWKQLIDSYKASLSNDEGQDLTNKLDLISKYMIGEAPDVSSKLELIKYFAENNVSLSPNGGRSPISEMIHACDDIGEKSNMFETLKKILGFKGTLEAGGYGAQEYLTQILYAGAKLNLSALYCEVDYLQSRNFIDITDPIMCKLFSDTPDKAYIDSYFRVHGIFAGKTATRAPDTWDGVSGRLPDGAIDDGKVGFWSLPQEVLYKIAEYLAIFEFRTVEYENGTTKLYLQSACLLNAGCEIVEYTTKEEGKVQVVGESGGDSAGAAPE